jgi:hypothetical protein
MGLKNILKIKYSLFRHGKFLFNNRLLYNCILAYIFLYIDIVVPQRTNTNGGKVFIAIAFYATFIALTKTIFAVYNHFKWILF